MANPTAAMLVIGDEILSGRTRDANMYFLAGELTKHGLDLAEVRIVSDDSDAIVAAVKALVLRDEDATLPELNERIETEREESVILVIMGAISALNAANPDWIAKLVEYTQHEKVQVRNGALLNLAELGAADDELFLEEIGRAHV